MNKKTLIYRNAKRNITFSASHTCIVKPNVQMLVNFFGIWTLFLIQDDWNQW